MAKIEFNPFTGKFDLTGGGGASYIDGVVADSSLLPVTLGTPALDAVYLAKAGSGVWLINRKPAGLYVRVANNGVAADWTYLGAFPEVNSSANWALYDGTTPSKELKFDLAGISSSTVRTITVPDSNVTLPNQGTSTTSDVVFNSVEVFDANNDESVVRLTGTTSNIIEFETQELSLNHTGGNDTPYISVSDGVDEALLGLRQGEMFLQGSNPDVRIEQGGGNLANILMVETKLEDAQGGNGHFATITADGELTDNRTLTVPDASGTLALTSDFAAPPAIGSTTPAAISGTTGTFTTLSAAPTSGSALTLTGGTVAASAPLISATQTWNDNAVTFTGLAATITNTASATASLVARLTVGSTNVFEVDGRGFTTLRKVATTTDFVNMFTARRGTTQICAVRDDGAVNANSFSTNASGGGQSFISDDGFAVRSSGSFRISSDTAAFTPDVYLRRDAAGVFAQYNGTNAQEYRVYGTYTSATNYQRLAIKTKSITLSALTGASVATTTGLIPDGAVLVGLTTRVSTAITGATGYDIGDGSDADRWGANIGFALNTSSDNTNWTAGTIECFTAAQEVTLTAVGSNFTGGAVVIVAHYLAGEAD